MFEECTAPINSLVDLASLSTPVNDLSTLQLSIYLSLTVNSSTHRYQLTAVDSYILVSRACDHFYQLICQLMAINSSVNSQSQLSTHPSTLQISTHLRFTYAIASQTLTHVSLRVSCFAQTTCSRKQLRCCAQAEQLASRRPSAKVLISELNLLQHRHRQKAFAAIVSCAKVGRTPGKP